jgi:hypothetical protein
MLYMLFIGIVTRSDGNYRESETPSVFWATPDFLNFPVRSLEAELAPIAHHVVHCCFFSQVLISPPPLGYHGRGCRSVARLPRPKPLLWVPTPLIVGAKAPDRGWACSDQAK